MNGRMAKLRRVQDLFVEGTTIVLKDGATEEPFWVSKPSTFERDEAVKDARSARARRALRFDRDESEQQTVLDTIESMNRDALLDSLTNARDNEFYVRGLDEIRANPEWKERIEAIDRAGLEKDRDVSDADRQVVSELVTEYMAEVTRLQKGFSDEYRAELADLTDKELGVKYREVWREMTSFEAFMETRRVTEIYFALRYCEATRVDDQWVHDKCDHLTRMLDDRDQVYDLPDALVVEVRTALEAMQMAPRDAGNSAAPGSSSASSEQPSEQAADSTPSGQATTSPEPAGTSSTP